MKARAEAIGTAEGTRLPTESGAAAELHEEELIMHLERDQFVSATSQPVVRAVLSGRAMAALWALRVFVLVVSAMVVYTFIDQLY